MEFTTRNTQHHMPAQPGAPAPAPVGNNQKPKPTKDVRPRWFKLAALILLYGGTIIVVAVLLFITYGSPNQESKFVNKNEMQAVFVNVNGTNGGQVYFGHIQDLTQTYIRMNNVFYIQNQQAAQGQNQAASQSYNLVKLGCELHGPEDQMIINRSEVFFWENLKNSGQVAQKATEFYKNNPNGQQNCDAQKSQGTQQSSTSTQTPATTTSPTTTTQGTSTKSQ